MMLENNPKKLTEEEQKMYENYRKIKRLTDRMIHCREFVDDDISKKMVGSANNWERGLIGEWWSRMKPTYLRLPHSNYNENILFICDESIKEKVFFSAFYIYPELLDFKFMDLLSLSDVCHRRSGRLDYDLEDFDTVRSWRDIHQEVLCTLASVYMAGVGDLPEIITALVTARSSKKGRHIDHQKTWVYFEGTIGELRNSRFSIWESFFKRHGMIIDLNPKSM